MSITVRICGLAHPRPGNLTRLPQGSGPAKIEYAPAVFNRPAPNLLIAGVQKAGTSWLHRRLAQHPDFFMSDPKELHFFQAPEKVHSTSEWKAYLDHFKGAEQYRWRGESTPNYFHSGPGPFSPDERADSAAEVARRLGADVQVVVSLRDPVSRAVSGYWHQFRRARLDLTESIFRLPTLWSIIDFGLYRRHYEHWARTVGADRIHVVLHDDLVNDPRGFLSAVLTKLDTPEPAPDVWGPKDLAERVNDPVWLRDYRRERNPITATEIAALLEIYRDDIAFVEELTGRSLDGWRDLDALVRRHAGG